MTRGWGLLAGVLLAAGATTAAAQELGRLFFTPQQRAELDARRKARVPGKPAAVVIEAPSTTLDGYVKRSHGNSTVWLNGKPVTEGADTRRAGVSPSRSDPSRASIEVSEHGRRILLKVGESLDRGTGEVRDLIGGGRITLERRPAGNR